MAPNPEDLTCQRSIALRIVHEYARSLTRTATVSNRAIAIYIYCLSEARTRGNKKASPQGEPREFFLPFCSTTRCLLFFLLECFNLYLWTTMVFCQQGRSFRIFYACDINRSMEKHAEYTVTVALRIYLVLLLPLGIIIHLSKFLLKKVFFSATRLQYLYERRLRNGAGALVLFSLYFVCCAYCATFFFLF